jgi:hypothetical protein
MSSDVLYGLIQYLKHKIHKSQFYRESTHGNDKEIYILYIIILVQNTRIQGACTSRVGEIRTSQHLEYYRDKKLHRNVQKTYSEVGVLRNDHPMGLKLHE